MRSQYGRLALLAAGILGWLAFVYMTFFTLTVGWRLTTGEVRQVDWHVFTAGARLLLEHRLYGVTLDAGGLVLSSPEFNHPPLAAAWALPLLLLPVEVGGTVWQVIGAASIAVAGSAAAALAGPRRPVLWAGAALGLLSFSVLYLEGLHLATNNYLELAFVAGFAWMYVRGGSDRWAGILLGLAIATKGWPLALAIVVIRERRWPVLAWAAGLVAIQGFLFWIWLGADLPWRMLESMRLQIPPTGFLIGPAAVDWLRPIWNSGVSLIVMLVLLAIPARGRAGLGLAILAGIAPIANLWIHYAPTLLFATALVIPTLAPRRTRQAQAGAALAETGGS